MVSRIFSILKGEFFMSLFEQINKDYVTAYKAKDTQRVSVLRMLKASVKNRLVDLCRPGGTLTDEEMMDVILKEGKQRRDSIAEYEKAGRQDLADKENAELVILETYLPKPLTDEELAGALPGAGRAKEPASDLPQESALLRGGSQHPALPAGRIHDPVLRPLRPALQGYV